MTNQDNIDAWSKVPTNVIAEFGDEGDFSRVHLLNPHLMRLLGDVSDKHILDAGCGNGYLSRKLAKLGAKITGVEPTQTLFDYAVQQEKTDPHHITYLQQDLSQFSQPNSFDIVISNMVFIDIPEYQTAMQNCIHALKLGGKFIFSITHPCFENSSAEFNANDHIKVNEYFQLYSKAMTYGFNYHRPLSNYINLIIKYHCQITEIVEPQLSSDITPDQKDHHIPSFLIISAQKHQNLTTP